MDQPNLEHLKEEDICTLKEMRLYELFFSYKQVLTKACIQVLTTSK
jgi:hypothetical protein